MAHVIEEGKPSRITGCEWCNSKIGYFKKDIITRPSRLYPLALMLKYIKCPKCGRMMMVGSYPKHSYDKGNYKLTTKDEDWLLGYNDTM